MRTAPRNEFLTYRDWHRAAIGGEDVILCHSSALLHLQLFVGYMNDKTIDVYAKQKGFYENINYRIVDTFDGIDAVRIGGLLCTSISQTVNDMLDDFDNTDEAALAEGLSRYYYEHNRNSFDGIHIKPENMEKFNYMREWAIEFFNTE